MKTEMAHTMFYRRILVEVMAGGELQTWGHTPSGVEFLLSTKGKRDLRKSGVFVISTEEYLREQLRNYNSKPVCRQIWT